jgi:hypothetical protein
MKKRLFGIGGTAVLALTMFATPVAASTDCSCEGAWASFDAQYLAKVLDQSLGIVISTDPNRGQAFRAVMHNLCEVIGMPPKFKDL